jgi:hypothetical protein
MSWVFRKSSSLEGNRPFRPLAKTLSGEIIKHYLNEDEALDLTIAGVGIRKPRGSFYSMAGGQRAG